MKEKTYSSRIEQPPPVPVTHPNVQNLAQRDGIRLAGWLGSSEVMRASPVVARCASLSLRKDGMVRASLSWGKRGRAEWLPAAPSTGRVRTGQAAPGGNWLVSDFQLQVGRAERFGVPAAVRIGAGGSRSGQVRAGQRRMMALSCLLLTAGNGQMSVTTLHLPNRHVSHGYSC